MSELRALGKVAGDYFAEGLNVIEGVHRAAARRTPAGRAHDAIAQGAYTAVRGAGRAATSAGAGGGGPAAPPFEGAGAHYACATISARHDDPLGWALGDLLVRHASASGGSPDARHFGARHHFHLLNDPEVYEALRTWLAEPSSRAGASPQSCSSR